MKNHLKRALIALMICSVAAATALAGKTKRAHLKFASDVMVDGTLLKAGAYDFKFNEESGELTILQDGEVKAKTAARLESRTEKARQTGVRTLRVGEVNQFMGLIFGGSSQEVVVTPRGTAAAAN